MIYNFIRILLLVLLVIVIFIEVPISPVLSLQINQLLIAIFIIFIIVAVDEIIGFLLGLIFLIIYFKYYQNIINKSNSNSINSNINGNINSNINGNINGINELKEPLINGYNPFNMNNIDKFSDDIKPIHNSKTESIPNSSSLNEKNNCIIMPYISTELLENAQNNIYNKENYYTEIRSGENVYGIQGLNSDQLHYNAFDKTNIINNYS